MIQLTTADRSGVMCRLRPNSSNVALYLQIASKPNVRLAFVHRRGRESSACAKAS
jgi:hypothetical protein